jgi:hypothetical protein
MNNKVFLSIPVYNSIVQFLNNQPHGAVRGLIDAMEKEVVPQAQAAQQPKVEEPLAETQEPTGLND